MAQRWRVVALLKMFKMHWLEFWADATLKKHNAHSKKRFEFGRKISHFAHTMDEFNRIPNG
jgi:hypothetical protein